MISIFFAQTSDRFSVNTSRFRHRPFWSPCGAFCIFLVHLTCSQGLTITKAKCTFLGHSQPLVLLRERALADFSKSMLVYPRQEEFLLRPFHTRGFQTRSSSFTGGELSSRTVGILISPVNLKRPSIDRQRSKKREEVGKQVSAFSATYPDRGGGPKKGHSSFFREPRNYRPLFRSSAGWDLEAGWGGQKWRDRGSFRNLRKIKDLPTACRRRRVDFFAGESFLPC